MCPIFAGGWWWHHVVARCGHHCTTTTISHITTEHHHCPLPGSRAGHTLCYTGIRTDKLFGQWRFLKPAICYVLCGQASQFWIHLLCLKACLKCLAKILDCESANSHFQQWEGLNRGILQAQFKMVWVRLQLQSPCTTYSSLAWHLSNGLMVWHSAYLRGVYTVHCTVQVHCTIAPCTRVTMWPCTTLQGVRAPWPAVTQLCIILHI